MTTQIMPHNKEDQIKENMDNMYRWTRHIYDVTRKYYLLGRDRLIDNLNVNDDELVCEIGCGTARNLAKMAKKYPNAKFMGLDASDEMLKTARGNLEQCGLVDTVVIKQAFSQSFQPESLFGISTKIDKMVFSYALSIIPPWKESIDHAFDLLPSGGELHIVDFGSQEDIAKPISKFIFWWLKMFHVYYKPEILEYLKEMDAQKKGNIQFETLYRGYSYRAVFRKN